MHSVENLSKNRIKEIQKLHQKKYREEKSLFIAEGKKALDEILSENIEIVSVYMLESAKHFLKLYNELVELTIINENEMKKISTTASACEILTIAKQKKYKPDDIKNKKHIILLDSVSDPGNLGTIIRSAAAFDIDAIILFNNCIELYSPKVLRSTAGNFFKVPVIQLKNEEDIKKYFPNHTLIATALSKENNITLQDAANIDKYIIMFGSEATGLTKSLINIADNNILLNMNKNVESLNLSVSASIILYELFVNRKC